MRELTVNLWSVSADLLVITTNGYVTKRGAAVMGRGCAKEAKDRYPDLPHKLGSFLERYGNRAMLLGIYDGSELCSFPVKKHWRDYADLSLILRSTHQLLKIVDRYGYERVVLPRPGCGNGGLLWSAVKPVIDPLLDDRFTVVSYPGEED
jgi:hypothetical protein